MKNSYWSRDRHRFNNERIYEQLNFTPFHLHRYYTGSASNSEMLLNIKLERILWHVDPLLGNGEEVSNYTRAVAK
jgi:hypothetical protein